jgi:hypothetical protein
MDRKHHKGSIDMWKWGMGKRGWGRGRTRGWFMLCVFLCCEARNRCPTALGGSGLVEVASCSQGGSSVVRRVGETFRRWEAASWSGEQRWRLIRHIGRWGGGWDVLGACGGRPEMWRPHAVGLRLLTLFSTRWVSDKVGSRPQLGNLDTWLKNWEVSFSELTVKLGSTDGSGISGTRTLI